MSSDDKKNKAQANNDDVVLSATVVEEAETQANTAQANIAQNLPAMVATPSSPSASLLSTASHLSPSLERMEQEGSTATSGDRAALNILNLRLANSYIDKGQYYCEWLNRSPLVPQKAAGNNGKEGPLELPCELLLRPHRFGKTFFLDMVQSIYEGRKELFTDTYLEKHWNWQQTPVQVIRIDFRELLPEGSETPYTYCAPNNPRIKAEWPWNEQKWQAYERCDDDNWVNHSIANLCRVSQEAFDASLLPSSTANVAKINEFIDRWLTQLYSLFYQECTKSVNKLEQEAFRKAMARATAKAGTAGIAGAAGVAEAAATGANAAGAAGIAAAERESVAGAGAASVVMDEAGVAGAGEECFASFDFGHEELSGTAHVDFSGHDEHLLSCLSRASPRTALWQLSLLLKSCRPQSRVLLIDNLDAPLFACLPHWEVYNHFARFLNSFLSVIASCRSTFVRIVATSSLGFRQLDTRMRNARAPILPISLPFYGPSLGKICGFTTQEVTETFASKLQQAQNSMSHEQQSKAEPIAEPIAEPTQPIQEQLIASMSDMCGGYYFGSDEEILHPTHVLDFFKDPLLNFRSPDLEVSIPDWDYIKGVGHYNNLAFYDLLSQLLQHSRSYMPMPRGKSSDVWYYPHGQSWAAKQASIYGDPPSLYANKIAAFVDPLGKWQWTMETGSAKRSIFATIMSEAQEEHSGTAVSATKFARVAGVDQAQAQAETKAKTKTTDAASDTAAAGQNVAANTANTVKANAANAAKAANEANAAQGASTAAVSAKAAAPAATASAAAQAKAQSQRGAGQAASTQGVQGAAGQAVSGHGVQGAQAAGERGNQAKRGGETSPWPMEWAALPSRLVPLMPLFNRNNFDSALALLELHGFRFKKQENLRHLYSSLGLGGDPIFGILLGNILLANEYLQNIFSEPNGMPNEDFFKIPKEVTEELLQIRKAAYVADIQADDDFWLDFGSFTGNFVPTAYSAVFRRQYQQCRKNDCFSNVLKELMRLQKEQIKEQYTEEAARLGQNRFPQEQEAVATKPNKQKAVIALNEPVLETGAQEAQEKPETRNESVSHEPSVMAAACQASQASQGEADVSDADVGLIGANSADAASSNEAQASDAPDDASDAGVLLPQLHEIIVPITEGKAVTPTGQLVEIEMPNLMREQLYEIVRISLNSRKRMKQTQEAVAKASAAADNLKDRVQLVVQGGAAAGTATEAGAVPTVESNESHAGFMVDIIRRAQAHWRAKVQASERAKVLAVDSDIPAATVITEDVAIAAEQAAKQAVQSGDTRLKTTNLLEHAQQADKKVQQKVAVAKKAEAEKKKDIHEEPDSAVIKSLKALSPEQFFVGMVSMATVTQEVLDAITHIAISVTNLQDMASVDEDKHFKWIFPRYTPDLSVPKMFYPLLEPGLKFDAEGTDNEVTLVDEKDKDSTWFKMREDLPPTSLWNDYTPLKVKRIINALQEWKWRKLSQRGRESHFFTDHVSFNHLYSLRPTIGPYTLARAMGSFDDFLMPSVLDNLAQAFYLAMGAKYQLCKLLNTYNMSPIEGYDNVHVFDLLQGLGYINIRRVSDGVCEVSIPNHKVRELMRRSLLRWCFSGPYAQYAKTWTKAELQDWSFFAGDFNSYRHVLLLDAIVKGYAWTSATQFNAAFICHLLRFWLVLNIEPAWMASKKLQLLVGSVEPPLPAHVARRYAMDKARSLGINLDCENSIVEMYPEFYPQQHHCLAYIVDETKAIIFEVVYIRSLEHSLAVTQYMRQKLLSVTNPLAALLGCHPSDPRVTKIKSVQRVVVTMGFLRDSVQVVSYAQLPKLKVRAAAASAAAASASASATAKAVAKVSAAVNTNAVDTAVTSARNAPNVTPNTEDKA